MLEKAGLEVRLLRYFNCAISPLIWLHRRCAAQPLTEGPAQATLARELRPPFAAANKLLEWSIRAESALPVLGFPWGASLIALARRP